MGKWITRRAKINVAIAIGLVGVVSCIMQWRPGTDWSGGVTMKFATSACLFILAICTSIKFAIHQDEPAKETRQRIGDALCVMSSVVFFYNLALLVLPRAKDWFVQEPESWSSLSTHPGMPSLSTVVVLFVMSVTSIGVSLQSGLLRVYNLASSFVACVGLVALIGHASNQPLLFYYWDGVSTGMAIPTAVILVLLGSSQLPDQIE